MTVKEFYDFCAANNLEERLLFIPNEDRTKMVPVEPEDIVIGIFGIGVCKGELCEEK